MYIKIKIFLSLFILAAFFASCNYSFKGASPPDGIITIYIPTLKDESNFGIAQLGENMTLILKNKFIRDNTLQYDEKVKADGMLSCIITNIKDEVLVVSGGEQVSKRKITINVKVDFQNLKKNRLVWEKDFSNWGEYESSDGGFSRRDEGLTSAIDRVTDDILLEVISNW